MEIGGIPGGTEDAEERLSVVSTETKGRRRERCRWPRRWGMLRGLRVDARCLATHPQHPSWTTATAVAIDDFHDHCCCCTRPPLFRIDNHAPTSRSLDSSWFPSNVCVYVSVYVCVCVCVACAYVYFFPGEFWNLPIWINIGCWKLRSSEKFWKSVLRNFMKDERNEFRSEWILFLRNLKILRI